MSVFPPVPPPVPQAPAPPPENEPEPEPPPAPGTPEEVLITPNQASTGRRAGDVATVEVA